MRFTSSLYLAATATAFVLPDDSFAPQLPLSRPHHDDDLPATWHSEVSAVKDRISTAFEETVDHLSTGFDSAIHSVESAVDDFHDSFSEQLDKVINGDADADILDRPHHGGGRHGKHGRDFTDLTIHEIITKSNYTTRLAKLLEDFPDVVDRLKSTKANHTFFVPVDSAFDRIPEDAPKPKKEFVERLINYHLGLGNYPARRTLKSHTIPTALQEAELGDEPQRLRVSVGLWGVKLNFYAKIIAADFAAKNGFIHAIDNFLVPPPPAATQLGFFPSSFSTLLLAIEKTDLLDYLHSVDHAGSTVFAPTNSAFTRLGARANAFLFNTKTGHKYLTAILKYHVALNATLYTDAFYDKTGSKDGDDAASAQGHEHYELHTALNGAPLGVDIGTILGFVSVKVNGFARVQVTDAVAKDGVTQVVNRVLIPPHKHKQSNIGDDDEDISVEELMERLDEYLD